MRQHVARILGARRKKKLEKKTGCTIAARIMSTVLAVGGDGKNGSPVERQGIGGRSSSEVDDSFEDDIADEPDEESEEDSMDEDGDTNSGAPRASTAAMSKCLEDQWVTVIIPDAFRSTEVFEALLENIMFVLGEPVTLGFLPFFTHDVDADNSVQHNEPGQLGDVNGALQVRGDSAPFVDRTETAPASASCLDHDDVWDDWTKRYCSLLEERAADGSNRFETDAGHRAVVLDMLTKETEAVHRETRTVMESFAKCEHDGVDVTMYPCSTCMSEVDKSAKQIREQNNVLYVLINEIVRVGKQAPVLSRTASDISVQLINAKLDALKAYKTEVAKNIHVSVSRYWRLYGKCRGVTVQHSHNGEDEVESMFVFPGRQQLRVPFKTDRKDKMDCTKKYYTSRPNVSSFISLQCPCHHPKIIGFTLIKEVETIAMAISTIMAFLRFTPRTFWYDNACNLYDSALLRMPFLLRTSYLMVDRFHYHGHTCSNHYNPNRYHSLIKQRSVAAEVMNAVLEKSAGFIRYLKGRNVKSYLKILFAMHNFTSMIKDDLNRKELPLLEYGELYNERFPCTCMLCIVRRDRGAWEFTTVDSVTYLPIHVMPPGASQQGEAGRHSPSSVDDGESELSSRTDGEGGNDNATVAGE